MNALGRSVIIIKNSDNIQREATLVKRRQSVEKECIMHYTLPKMTPSHTSTTLWPTPEDDPKTALVVHFAHTQRWPQTHTSDTLIPHWKMTPKVRSHNGELHLKLFGQWLRLHLFVTYLWPQNGTGLKGDNSSQN